jgi:hypothetical protein
MCAFVLRFVDLSLSTNYRCPSATSAIFIALASDSGGQIAIDRDSVTGIEHLGGPASG